MREKSSGEWKFRLGGNAEVADKLDFLRDKGREEHVRRTAEREAAAKASCVCLLFARLLSKFPAPSLLVAGRRTRRSPTNILPEKSKMCGACEKNARCEVLSALSRPGAPCPLLVRPRRQNTDALLLLRPGILGSDC
jgi:hypothetical protein